MPISVCADGLLVMKNGVVLYEYLVEGIPVWKTHGINSASKVFTGCVAAILADQGKLSWDKPLHEYASQLKGTGEALRNLNKISKGCALIPACVPDWALGSQGTFLCVTWHPRIKLCMYPGMPHYALTLCWLQSVPLWGMQHRQACLQT